MLRIAQMESPVFLSRNGVPEGDGEFRYVNGDVETAVWKGGERCGLSVYKSETCEEHISFTDGFVKSHSCEPYMEEQYWWNSLFFIVVDL